MISVCIASYNGEKYIGKQIESIVEQLGGDDELIVSDDGSTDATREVVASFADSRIRLIDHSSHRPKRVKYAFEYVTHNFDYALRHTRGENVPSAWADGTNKTAKLKAAAQRRKRLFMKNILLR